MKVASVTITENKRVWSMIMTCKKCGKDMTSQAILVLEGKIAKVNCESSQCKYELLKIIIIWNL